ncbi:hypothetical protein AX774_g2920 [Zancudomyces culisetae]|uniref:Uncharacterized protein n=1 Tax=Zancudomyces culisetae TaxID=1213189 RepID=A0A1R1PRJ7_ZANCU|nr:hypothetical protein AX774_g2920 [Zancudomyces culisetae]|eukprot:OMH83571.1 hypothetical protein AX774_g2920 [Zancudomyces culisetae]
MLQILPYKRFNFLCCPVTLTPNRSYSYSQPFPTTYVSFHTHFISISPSYSYFTTLCDFPPILKIPLLTVTRVLIGTHCQSQLAIPISRFYFARFSFKRKNMILF